MRFPLTLLLAPCVLAVFSLTGCIPSEPEPEPRQTPSPKLELPPLPEVDEETDGNGLADEAAAPEEEALPPGKSRVRMDLTPGANAGVMVSKLGEGFFVEGQLGPESASKIQATIMPRAEGGWNFNGQFTFKTGGYSVGEPFGSMLQDRTLGTEVPGSIVETNVYMLSIPVRTPRKDDMVTKAIEVHPLQFPIDAPADVEFSVVLISG